jgi:hypothetical protein
MLEGRGSCILFPCENRINIYKEYCLPLKVLQCEELHNCAKELLSSEWKKHYISWKKTIYVKSRRV